MKGFFNLFKSSALELKNVRTLTVTGILIATSLVVKMFTINLGGELKISLGFIPLCVIAMLYGPVVCSMSAFSVDLLGYFVENNAGQPYYPPIALVVILSGIVYGLFLYKNEAKLRNIILAKACVNIFFNLGLNSYLIYTGFINNNFDITNTSDLTVFFTWMVANGRLLKNVVLLPFEILALAFILPLAKNAFNRIIKRNRA